MKKISLPINYNYIAVFLTLRCNLGCDYCINKQGGFMPREELNYEQWVQALSRIDTREDLPLSIQGGEPTIHKDFYAIVNELHRLGKHLDLLTNGLFDVADFMHYINTDVFKRNAPYASIRFSLHKNTDVHSLLTKVNMLSESGYSVGIWGLDFPGYELANKDIALKCKRLGIDFRIKEYLDNRHGTYKYQDATTGLKYRQVECKPSELLIAPDGAIFRCHSDLYTNRCGYDNILHEGVELITGFAPCDFYGLCNPCDIKVKTNRLQEYGHTSVEIRSA